MDFSLRNDSATCRCGSTFTYKEDGTIGTSSFNSHLKQCSVKNYNTNQAAIVYDFFSIASTIHRSLIHHCILIKPLVTTIVKI